MGLRSGRALYGLLVTLIVAQGTWWVIYQTREGRRYEEAELRRLDARRGHAEALLAGDPAPSPGELRQRFPELAIGPGPGPVRVDPDAVLAIRDEGRRRRRMFQLEGTFFLVLLGAATLVLAFAHRAEDRFRRSREVLLAGITHEFRTPLASLRLWAETLQRDDLDEQTRERIRGRLVEDVGRLESLVGQVLAAGRGGEMDPRLFEALDAGREAKDVLREMEGYLELQGAEVSAELPEGIEFLGQREAFAVAFRNLVQNAAKYSQKPARIDVTLTQDGRWLRLAVRDRGPGIPRADHRRVFESFTRLDEPERDGSTSTRGAGLGLFLVKRNAEAMGGRVELASEVAAGSTFTLVLPSRPEES
jgi:signal transduction histidine kinase